MANSLKLKCLTSAHSSQRGSQTLPFCFSIQNSWKWYLNSYLLLQTYRLLRLILLHVNCKIKQSILLESWRVGRKEWVWMRKMLGKYVYAWKIPSLAGLLPVSSSSTHTWSLWLSSWPTWSTWEKKRWRHFTLCPSCRGTHSERQAPTPFFVGQNTGSKPKKARPSICFLP